LDSSGKHIQGVYCTGWIKRGPVGLIGHTKADAIETIGHLIEDRATWWSPEMPGEDAILQTLVDRGVNFMDWSHWLKVDAEERRLGQSDGRERIKLFDRGEILKVSKGN
jgi:ferredoxin--NADP+ reductase